MTEWNFDMSAAPRGQIIEREYSFVSDGQKHIRTVKEFVPEKIWAGLHTGEVVVSQFCRPTKTSPEGWWSMVGNESRIKAWMPFLKPVPTW